jgi:hypothetical protein
MQRGHRQARAALGMNMQVVFTSMVCLGLLIWVEPVSAQVTHELTVSHHPGIALSDGEVDEIIAEASTLLKKNSCNVTFKRKGSVQPFTTPTTPQIITTETHRDAVHGETSDVKVVETIGFCRGGGPHAGCAWDPPPGGNKPQRRSMIVEHRPEAMRSRGDKVKVLGALWAHEFGHRTGLWHRNELDALMTICSLTLDQVVRQDKVDSRECACFLAGPGSCMTPEPPARCPIP